MINGVLVERTVKDVIPSLKTNSEGLKQVLDDLLKQYKTKQDEMDMWKVRWPFLDPVFSKSGSHSSESELDGGATQFKRIQSDVRPEKEQCPSRATIDPAPVPRWMVANRQRPIHRPLDHHCRMTRNA